LESYKERDHQEALDMVEDNIKIDLRETEWGDMDWIDVAEDGVQWRALVNTVMNLRVPLMLGNSS
jgi:hypothetical protein